MPTGPRVEFFPSGDEWAFHVRAGNNEIVGQGESYKNLEDAKTTVRQYFHPDLAWFVLTDDGWKQTSSS